MFTQLRLETLGKVFRSPCTGRVCRRYFLFVPVRVLLDSYVTFHHRHSHKGSGRLSRFHGPNRESTQVSVDTVAPNDTQNDRDNMFLIHYFYVITKLRNYILYILPIINYNNNNTISSSLFL